MSNPPDCGRTTPRWSVGRDGAESAVLIAGLPRKIALVGVLPGLFSCSGCSRGLLVLTTPGHAENDPVPEPLLVIKLPAPLTFMLPVKKHSLFPLLAMIVLFRMKLIGALPPW